MCKKVFPSQACSSGPLVKMSLALLGKADFWGYVPNPRQPRTPALGVDGSKRYVRGSLASLNF